MSRYLCTFSGKFGDILWALPTVRELSRLMNAPVDIAVMPNYGSLVPLLQAQSYIDKAFAVSDWTEVNANYGSQPWQPPEHISDSYQKVWHLGYRHHPDRPLIDFTAFQQGISFKGSPVPFIEIASQNILEPMVTCAFNDQYNEVKRAFREKFVNLLIDIGVSFQDISGMSWLEAASWCKSSLCYVGDKSAIHVLAHGVGQKTVIIFEPHPAKNRFGTLGNTFSCPYVMEFGIHWDVPVNKQVKNIISMITQLRDNVRVSALEIR